MKACFSPSSAWSPTVADRSAIAAPTLLPTVADRSVIAPPALCLLLLCCCGCTSWLPEMVPFGAVSAPDHYRSLNGLGAHTKMWQRAGAKVLTPKKLSPKMESMDVIVLVGQTYAPPGKAARDWLEGWLARKAGRTVIYFGRDFNADIYYRQRTLAELSGGVRERGAELLGLRQAEELSSRVEQLPENTFCRWFYLDSSQRRTQLEQFSGPWADGLPDSQGYWPVDTRLLPPDRGWKSKLPSWLTSPPTALQPVVIEAASGSSDNLVVQSRWRVDELDTQEKWDREFENIPQSKILLSSTATGDGREIPLVFQLTHRRFRRGQILIAVNGAPFLNGSLVDRLHQQIGERIIEECLPAERVALLAYGSGGILITNAVEQDARGLGLEMLTVWPLSAVTMPAALLGIVICAALLPILGRPQSLPRRSVSDFGLHVRAIGRMLLDSRDENYARATIAAYFRRVRGESPPGWLEAGSAGMPEAPPQAISDNVSTH